MAPRALLSQFLLLAASAVFIQLSVAQAPSSTTPCHAPATWSAPAGVATQSALRDIAYCTGDYNYDAQASGDEDAGPSDSERQNNAGASGDGKSFVNLSTADQVAIIVVAVVVGVFGIGSAILYYVAKKRQWELREKLRRSARSVKTALTPRATQTKFNRNERGVSRVADDSPSRVSTRQATKKPSVVKTDVKEGQNAAEEAKGGKPRFAGMPSDAEKGMGTKTTVTGVSSFDVESPTSPKSWKEKLFGGKKR